MNVRDFLDVRVICESGSLRKAAAVLGVTQPTLSNRIAHLEDQLGAQLFDRSRGHSRPTDLALFIARRAANMAEDAARLDEEARRLSSGKGGVVRIGMTAGLRTMVRDIVADVSERYPRISLDILVGPMLQLQERLLERKLDLLMCPALDAESGTLAHELLLESDVIVVAHPDHPMCSDPPQSVPGLFKYPIALSVTERFYLERVQRDYGIDLDALPGRVLCSDPSMLALIVHKSRKLFTAAPSFFFEPELESGLLQVVDTPVPIRHQLYLHWDRDAFSLPAVQRVQQLVREYFSAARSKGTYARRAVSKQA